MKLDKKKAMLGGVILLVLIIVGFFLIKKSSKFQKNDGSVTPTEAILPTVDSSVKVDFGLIKNGEVRLNVSNAPQTTRLVEYELVYAVINTDINEGGSETVDQGAIGKCYLLDDIWQCGETDEQSGHKIVLGTCSSGVCRYHNIVGKVKVHLKFTGDYGEKLFEKEYAI